MVVEPIRVRMFFVSGYFFVGVKTSPTILVRNVPGCMGSNRLGQNGPHWTGIDPMGRRNKQRERERDLFCFRFSGRLWSINLLCLMKIFFE